MQIFLNDRSYKIFADDFVLTLFTGGLWATGNNNGEARSVTLTDQTCTLCLYVDII